MIPLTLGEIAAACGGRLEQAEASMVVHGVAIDSRTVRDGDLFVALPGEHADGHAYAAGAIARGAVAVLAREDVDGLAAPAIRVPDPAAALTRVAALVRDRSSAHVVAITGSSGKTCTKQFTAAIARARFRTVASEASYNNELGVPLTVCSLEPDTEVLVAEVGSRGVGHIATLIPLVLPDVSIVTNVGSAHYEMFGSLDATERAKGEIVEALRPSGTAVLNADDARVMAMAARTDARVLTYGLDAGADVRAERVELDARACARFEVVAGDARAKVALEMAGEHMVPNALAAVAAGLALGVPLDASASALAEAVPVAWRMEIVETPRGVTLVNDAYNANPASAAAALRTLASLGAGRRTWAVLGEMAELGPITAEEHDRLGRLAARLGIKRLVAVGEVARPACQAARLECLTPEEAVWVADVQGAIEVLRAELAPGDVVLLKASRVAGLERIAAALLEDGA